MTLDIDPIQLRLEPEHTKSWYRLGMLFGSLVGKNQVVAWMELEISMETRFHLVEEECVV